MKNLAKQQGMCRMLEQLEPDRPNYSCQGEGCSRILDFSEKEGYVHHKYVA